MDLFYYKKSNKHSLRITALPFRVRDNLAGPIWRETIFRDQFVGKPICRQAYLAASQFGGKINNNDLPSLASKRQQKGFVMSQRQLKRQL